MKVHVLHSLRLYCMNPDIRVLDRTNPDRESIWSSRRVSHCLRVANSLTSYTVMKAEIPSTTTLVIMKKVSDFHHIHITTCRRHNANLKTNAKVLSPCLPPLSLKPSLLGLVSRLLGLSLLPRNIIKADIPRCMRVPIRHITYNSSYKLSLLHLMTPLGAYYMIC